MLGYYIGKKVRWIKSNLGSGKKDGEWREEASRLLQINRVKSRRQQLLSLMFPDWNKSNPGVKCLKWEQTF